MKAQIAQMAVTMVAVIGGLTAAGRAQAAEIAFKVVELRCEYLVDPMGIDVIRPRLSWRLEPTDPAARNVAQRAYRVLVASSLANLQADQGDLWDSTTLSSDQSVHVEYAGRPLDSQAKCFWKVRVWDTREASAWSAPAQWSMGLLRAKDWKATWIGLDKEDVQPQSVNPLSKSQWIGYPEENPAANAPVGKRYFRRAVTLPQAAQVNKALCRITADNAFVLYVNGKKIGDGSSFTQVFEFDVTNDLQGALNVLAVEASNVGEAPNPAGLIAALEVTFEQGQPIVLVTDQQWKASQKADEGWEKRDFDDAAWPASQQLGAYGMPPWGRIGQPDATRLTARMLRTEFAVDKKIKRATAYICGLGLYELYLNGQRIGENVLDPGLTDYAKRSFYVTYDITGQLKQGRNAVGVILGTGRYYAPRKVVPTNTRTFGYPKLLLQMNVQYDDGSSQQIISDDSWKLTTKGPIRANNEYDGEEYDARLEQKGWSEPDFNDSAWQKPQLVKAPEGVLSAQMLQPIRVVETIQPIKLTQPRPGVFILDMGQNMVGWCRLRVKGEKGRQITLRHAEILKTDGTLYLDNIRSAKVTDTYVLKGEGEEVWEPKFVYHGFRYVEVTGWPGEPPLSAIDGRVVNSAVETTGEFSCSNPLLNQIHKNIFWGVRGNYRSFPTDCPQRDERQAWLGDRSAECKGETYLLNIASLYGKWMQDIEDSQKDTGSVSDVSPSYWPFYNDNVTWPSTFIIAPGTLYEQYADKAVIANRYPAMRKWIEHMRQYIKDDLMPRDTYGDWCAPPESQQLIHSNDPLRKTNGTLLGTAYFYYDLRRMAQYASLLGKTDDAREFESLADRMKAGFNRKFFKPQESIYDNGSQTSSVLPLAFGLVPQEHRDRVFKILAAKIESLGHLGTGLIGGQWLMRVLSDNGRADLAYMLASRKAYPSWGYMIEKGATTIWELWNGDTADPSMNSGNHVMLVGDLAIWFYEYVAGIKPDVSRPGFKHIILNPHAVGDLSFAKASYNTLYGVVQSDWKIDGDRFLWNVTVPPNTTATAHVPASDQKTVTEGGKPASQSSGVKLVKMENGAAVYELGSGRYQFIAMRRR